MSSLEVKIAPFLLGETTAEVYFNCPSPKNLKNMFKGRGVA